MQKNCVLTAFEPASSGSVSKTLQSNYYMPFVLKKSKTTIFCEQRLKRLNAGLMVLLELSELKPMEYGFHFNFSSKLLNLFWMLHGAEQSWKVIIKNPPTLATPRSTRPKAVNMPQTVYYLHTWSFAMVLIKEVNTISSQTIWRLLERLLLGDHNRNSSFCDAKANNCDKLALKIFINIIAKPYAKRLTVSLK